MPKLHREMPLTTEQQYRQDAMQQSMVISDEQKNALVHRARAGDEAAREEIILSFVRYCAALAARYTRTYAWASPRIEYLDLAQMGMLTVIQTLDRALQQEKPFLYLVVTVRNEISDYCLSHTSLITTPEVHTPDRPFFPRKEVVSLDTPISEDGPDTVGDLLAAPTPTEGDDPQEKYRRLYEAVERLPEKRRHIVKRHWGLQCAPESLNAIGRRSGAYTQHSRALATLRQQLEGVYAYA